MAKDKKQAKPIQVTEKVMQAIVEAEKAVSLGENEMVLTSGVRVKFRPLPPLLQRAVEGKFPEPEVPMALVTIRGEQELESNPNDPDYIAARWRWAVDRGNALTDLALLKGVAVELPEDESWIEELAMVGIEVGKSKMAKKLAYLHSVAIASLEDLTGVTSRVLAMSGLSPQAIDKASKSLQD